MTLRFKFCRSQTEKYVDSLRHGTSLGEVQTKDQFVALAAASLILASNEKESFDLGPSPSLSQIEQEEQRSQLHFLPLHAAAQLSRHLLHARDYETKFEDTIEVDLETQDNFPYFSRSSRFVSGVKSGVQLDLQTSLFFESAT
jgi:hypothetical protein